VADAAEIADGRVRVPRVKRKPRSSNEEDAEESKRAE